MNSTPIERWHHVVRTRNATELADLLANDAVFYSPVVHSAQLGKAITLQYLTAAMHVFLNDSFHYVRQVVGPNDAVLEFEVTLDGTVVNGVDMLRWNDAGQITEFKVMLRPMKAVQLIQAKMAAMLSASNK